MKGSEQRKAKLARRGGDMEKILGEIEKTQSVKLMVRLTEFKGRNLLDIRDFFKPKNGIDYTPTKKGTTIDIGRIPELVTLLEQAEAEALKK